MTPFSGGSNASASASVTAVIMFTHRICAGVIGSMVPNATAARIVMASPPLVGRMKVMAFLMLS